MCIAVKVQKFDSPLTLAAQKKQESFDTFACYHRGKKNLQDEWLLHLLVQRCCQLKTFGGAIPPNTNPPARAVH